MNCLIEIAQDFDDWNLQQEVNEKLFQDLIYLVLQNHKNLLQIKDIELSILLTSDSRIEALNYEFRKKKKSTNVLSFQDLDWSYKDLENIEIDDYIYLGDIAFSYEKIKKEAIEKNVRFIDHFKHLAIHAILHLIGYDHIDDDDAVVMQDLEIKLLNKINIDSPY